MSDDGHLSFDDLARLADGGPLDAAEETHLAQCDACRTDLVLLRRMDLSWSYESGEADAEPDAWDAGPADPFADAAAEETTRQHVLAFARRMADEDEAARLLLEPLVSGDTANFVLGIARRGARYQTGGVVRFLCAAAHEALEESPLKALILADEAIAIASLLRDASYPPGHVDVLRGNAWRFTIVWIGATRRGRLRIGRRRSFLYSETSSATRTRALSKQV